MKYILMLVIYTNVSIGQEVNSSGNVQLPLNTYNNLIESSQNPEDKAPADYAIGQSKISVTMSEKDSRTSAQVRIQTSIRLFEDKWTLVPILPYGAAITSVRIDGESVSLVQNSEWLSWSAKKAGTYQLVLNYSLDANRSDLGYVLTLPIPRASSNDFELEFPNNQVDLAVVPSSKLEYGINNNTTIAKASIPTTSSVLVSWHVASEQSYVISRAKYEGKLQDKIITFNTQYVVELFSGESVKIDLMPNSVTLNDVKVDNKSATVFDQDGKFQVIMQGKGLHTVNLIFQVQVNENQGPPSIGFPIPKVPISQFDLHLDGKKDVSVISNNQVETQMMNQINDEKTVASVYLPLSESVNFSWVDAVPKNIVNKLRANANVYHAISAEEGVLYGQAIIDYEITHGETSSLSFTVPASAQVNRISSTTAGVSDWSVDETDKTKVVNVFLDRSINDNYQLKIDYEQLLNNSDKQQAIEVPLIRAEKMHRQRGIVALLAGTELALKPIEEVEITRVGENQLPAFFKNQISLTIAHTFKYTSQTPNLVVNTIAPERKQGKYDAQVDTLVSLGEVTMRGSAGLQIDVKSGAIVDLNLQLPKNINILNVTGPSIRNHKTVLADNNQNINIEFTQEMQGQFRIDVNYEMILGEKKSELDVPSLQVLGSEVQHGRIAVEALTAVEVKTAETQQLSTLAINELPQQLVLKTTNPILLAFKYVNTESPHLLKLSMTRHKEIDVQVASIESANYQTLFTNDGLSITTAKFNVKNSRKQFLRLDLPKGSKVWSVFVDGKAEKPAIASNSDGSGILIKMLNSVTGFPVEVVYATNIHKMGMFGSLTSQLPIPDMVVTQSLWDVFLPIGPNYLSLKTNMNVSKYGNEVSSRTKKMINQSLLDSQSQVGNPLRVNVPKQGIHYSFEKLYANQSDVVASFELKYASEKSNQIGTIISIISVVVIWLAIFLLRMNSVSHKVIISTIIIGVLGLLLSIGYIQSNMKIAFSLAIVGGVFYLLMLSMIKYRNWMNEKIE